MTWEHLELCTWNKIVSHPRYCLDFITRQHLHRVRSHPKKTQLLKKLKSSLLSWIGTRQTKLPMVSTGSSFKTTLNSRMSRSLTSRATSNTSNNNSLRSLRKNGTSPRNKLLKEPSISSIRKRKSEVSTMQQLSTTNKTTLYRSMCWQQHKLD